MTLRPHPISRKACGLVTVLTLCANVAPACELCAIYSADSARGTSTSGFLFTVSEQYVHAHTIQTEGEEIDFAAGDRLDSSVTHLVPTWNFSERFGLSLNVPVVYRSFRRTDIHYSSDGTPAIITEDGHEFGLGDLSLIGRLRLLKISKMNYSLTANLLAGVKFPTGDTVRIREEVEQSRIFESLAPAQPHEDPLSHSIGSVHEHDLSPGSGSYDGIFGLTATSRWKRWIFNAQFQYYLRTRGESGFEYGDELMVSGGPGAYLLLHDLYTLSLQANAAYETRARDKVFGRKSDRTGMTAWYLGPQLVFTWGEHFAANAGVDIPLRIANNIFQNVPDYRIHGGLSVRF